MDGDRGWSEVAARFAEWRCIDRLRGTFLEAVSCNLTAEIAALTGVARAWAGADDAGALADQACVVLADAVLLGYLAGQAGLLPQQMEAALIDRRQP